MPRLLVGLNAYGIAYTVGLTGAGTPRANPRPLGMAGFIDLAGRIGAKAISLPIGWIEPLADAQRHLLAEQITTMGMRLIIDSPVMTGADRSLALCTQMGATLMRSTLSGVLEGGRAAQGDAWRQLLGRIGPAFGEAARAAIDRGITIALENHQDFTSAELADLCAQAGLSIGVCFDTGNALSVGEDPVSFARTVAPHLMMLHLKDYFVRWTDEGYRLVRCAIGDGAVPLVRIAEALAAAGCMVDPLPALIEPGALEQRHIRLLCDDWWEGYPPRTARQLAAGLAAARKGLLPEQEDWRTPWESGADSGTIVAYESRQLTRSVANLISLGFMGT